MEPLLVKILRLGPQFGRAASIQSQKVVVEFSSVNVGKPLHLGHLRSTIYGHFVRRINEMMGHDVVAINYLGDWGTQFGSLIQGFKMFGNPEKMRKDKVNHLFEVYVKMHAYRTGELSQTEQQGLEDQIQAYTSRMEKGDEELLGIWNDFKAISIEELKKTYLRMGIDFDLYQFESDFVQPGKEIVQRLLEQNMAWEEDGRVVCRGREGNVVLLKSSGSTLYITRDIAAALHRRKEFNFDRIHYVVAQSQAVHFQNLEYILKGSLGCDWVENSQPWGMHLGCGLVKGMSSRRGSVVLLRDVLDIARDACLSAIEKGDRVIDQAEALAVGDQLGWTSLVEALLRVSGKKPVTADFMHRANVSRSLQYCHARLCQLELKATSSGLTPMWSDRHSAALLNDPTFQQFHETLEKTEAVFLYAYENVDPSCLLKHAQSLRKCVSKMWVTFKVVNCEDKALGQMNLLAFMSARQVLRNIFHTIGIRPLEKV